MSDRWWYSHFSGSSREKAPAPSRPSLRRDTAYAYHFHATPSMSPRHLMREEDKDMLQ